MKHCEVLIISNAFMLLSMHSGGTRLHSLNELRIIFSICLFAQDQKSTTIGLVLTIMVMAPLPYACFILEISSECGNLSVPIIEGHGE